MLVWHQFRPSKLSLSLAHSQPKYCREEATSLANALTLIHVFIPNGTWVRMALRGRECRAVDHKSVLPPPCFLEEKNASCASLSSQDHNAPLTFARQSGVAVKGLE